MSESTDATEATITTPRPSLLERHFRAKLHRMYAKSADLQRRAPIATARAESKRQRKAAKRIRRS